MTTANLEILEKLLSDLYHSATMEPPALFQESALQKLNAVIGFDRAWWGIMSPTSSGFTLHSSYRHELPTAFEEHWKSVSGDDALASNVHSKPRTTVHFSCKDLHSTPGLLSLNLEHNLQQALCTSVFLPDQKSFLFISLFRSGKYAKAFNAKDISIKQYMTPYLYSAWRANLQVEIERVRIPNRLIDAATAFIDSTGNILCADSMFASILSEAWPNWNDGKRIPNAVWQFQDKQPPIPLHINRQHSGGLTRIDITRTPPFNRLSKREKQIAVEYSEGRSYKEIAAVLGLSPATVRTYLQVIYEKLSISDKAELVRMADSYRKTLSLRELMSSNKPFSNQCINFL